MTFPVAAPTTRTLVSPMVPLADGTPVFSYWGFDANLPAAVNQPIAVPVSAVNAQKVVQVDVSFVARPTKADGRQPARHDLPAVRVLPHGRPDRPREGTEMLGTRRHGEAGFTLVTVLGAMVVLALITVGAFAAVNGDAQQSGRDVARKQALAAAEAGVNQYLFGLNGDNNYWAKCTGVPAPNAVNDPWNGVGPDPRTWQSVPDGDDAVHDRAASRQRRAKCVTGPNVSDTVIDKGSRSIRIRVTGRAPTANGGWVYRSVIAGLKREGFLDFLWFTDLETSDPLLYLINTDGRPTTPSITAWADNATTGCRRYYRNNRGTAEYSGNYADGSQGRSTTTAPRSRSPPRTSWPARCTPTTRSTSAGPRPSGATSRTRSSRARRWRAVVHGRQPEHQGHVASQLVDDRHADDERVAEGDRGPELHLLRSDEDHARHARRGR